MVTCPIFSWFGVQGFLHKELLPCLPTQDAKAARKYTCLAELSRVFKNMIGLFLTTSYVLLRIKNTVSMPEPEFTTDMITEDSTDLFLAFNYDYMIDFLLPVATLCLMLLSIMIELQQVINLCLDFDEDEILGNNHENAENKKSKDYQGGSSQEQLDLNFVFNESSDDTIFE